MKRDSDRTQDNVADRLQLKLTNLQLILITILVAMLLLGPITLLRQIDASGRWRFLFFLIAFIAFEGVWTSRWLARAPRKINRTFYRLAELTILLLIIFFTYWISLESAERSALIDTIGGNPSAIIDLRIIMLLTLCLSAWFWSIHLAQIFNSLTLGEDEVLYFTTPSAERLVKGIAPGVPVYRNHIFHDFIRNWAIGGLILAFFAMLATFEYSSTNIEAIQALTFRNVTRLGLPPTLLIALILYFASGFWLASLGRISVMQARWVASGSEIESELMSRWQRHVLIIIVTVILLAAFLPIGSTVAFSQIIQAFISTLITAVTLVLAILPVLLTLLLSLFAGEQSGQEEPAGAPIGDGFPAPGEGAVSIEIPPRVLEGIYLSATIIIALSAFLYFVRFRKVEINWQRFNLIWINVIEWLRDYWTSLTVKGAALAENLRMRIRQPTSIRKMVNIPRFDFFFSSKSSREKVLTYYLWFVRLLEEKGLGRKPGQTPAEYGVILADKWPEASREIDRITNYFIEARYSHGAVSETRAKNAEKLLKKLRSRLKRKP